MTTVHPQQLERVFPGLLEQVAKARAFVAGCLAGLGCCEDAVLAVSELACNALTHSASGTAGGTFVVHICRSPRSVVVHVHDLGGQAAQGRPHTEMPGNDAEEGRGLPIVAAVSTAHGSTLTAACTGRPDTRGRCTWVRCDLSPGTDPPGPPAAAQERVSQDLRLDSPAVSQIPVKELSAK